MGDDYLRHQIYEDTRAREETLVVFVILVLVSIFLGLWIGRVLNRRGDSPYRMPGATAIALILGFVLGGGIAFILGFILGGGIRSFKQGMPLVGAVVFGLIAAQRATESNARAPSSGSDSPGLSAAPFYLCWSSGDPLARRGRCNCWR